MTYITIILRKKISDGFLLKVILKIASLSQKITLKRGYLHNFKLNFKPNLITWNNINTRGMSAAISTHGSLFY